MRRGVLTLQFPNPALAADDYDFQAAVFLGPRLDIGKHLFHEFPHLTAGEPDHAGETVETLDNPSDDDGMAPMPKLRPALLDLALDVIEVVLILVSKGFGDEGRSTFPAAQRLEPTGMASNMIRPSRPLDDVDVKSNRTAT